MSTLELINGASALITQDTFIGMDLGDQGRIEVANSTFTSHGLTVGFQGNGALEISQGGQVNCTDASLGLLDGSYGEIDLSDQSILNITNAIHIGQDGGAAPW